MRISFASIILPAACALLPAAAFSQGVYCNGSPDTKLYCIQNESDGPGQHVTDTDSTVQRIETGELQIIFDDWYGSFGTYLTTNPGAGLVQVPHDQAQSYMDWSNADMLGEGMDVAGNRYVFYGEIKPTSQAWLDQSGTNWSDSGGNTLQLEAPPS